MSKIKANLQIKATHSNSSLVTIITVVFNGVEFLEKTIKSVISQTYVEYIIIDGGSTDGTVDVIKKYEDKITHWVSEPDKGIYDAMNKGIDLASGKWINFMNAGDRFHSNKIIHEIFNGQTHDVDIVYGDVEFDQDGSLKVQKAKNIKALWRGMTFCHQSAFISIQYHKKHKYSLQYSIAGDFNFFYGALKHKARFKYIEIIVAVFSDGGVSSVIGAGAGRQNLRIVNSYGYNVKYNLYYFALFSYQIVKRMLNIFRFNGAK